MSSLNYYIHKTAIVDQGASIGENSKYGTGPISAQMQKLEKCKYG